MKKHPLRTILCAVALALIAWRIVAWWFPVHGAQQASFENAGIALTLQEITRSETQGEAKIRGSSEGEHLAINAPNAALFFSENAGETWQQRGQAGGWNDILVLPDGAYHIAETTIAGQQFPATIRYRSSAVSTPAEIYKAEMSENGLFGKEIRGIDIERGADELRILFKEGISGKYEYKMLRSKDGNVWTDEGPIQGIRNLDKLQNVSLAISREQDIFYMTFVEQDTEVFKTPPQLVLLQKTGVGWKKIQEGLGAGSVGRGFGSGIPFDAQVFADAEGNALVLWRHHFYKPRASSFFFPLDAIKHIPILKMAYGIFASRITNRDEIYFAKVSSGGKIEGPLRLNSATLENKQTVKLRQTGREEREETQERIAKYGISMKSSASENGKYIVALWTDYREEGRKPLYFSYSKDGGRRWSKNQAVYPELSDGALIFDAFISNSGGIYFVFSNPQTGVFYLATGKI